MERGATSVALRSLSRFLRPFWQLYAAWIDHADEDHPRLGAAGAGVLLPM
jgi:hypothetical protein